MVLSRGRYSDKLNVNQMADILNTNVEYIRSLCRQGKIPAKKEYSDMWFCNNVDFGEYLKQENLEAEYKKFLEYLKIEAIVNQRTE